MKKQKIAILELLVAGPEKAASRMLYNRLLTKQYVSIMPQIVSVWCREMGHEVHYCTYYGQSAVESVIPDNLDTLIISCYTKNCSLAYAIATLYRQKGVKTILGGPHAKVFAKDALRFFDIVVQRCDKELLNEVIRYDDLSVRKIFDCDRALMDIPSVEERLPEIKQASFINDKPTRFSVVPLLTSIGCPYTCNFCTDWSNDYKLLPTDRLYNDLKFMSSNYSDVLIGYHDPNFGVNFDTTMEVIQRIPKSQRNPYVMESSLSILRPKRMPTLGDTNCVFVLPGIESWDGYSKKAALRKNTGQDKLNEVIKHLNELSNHVEGIQANLIFGTDVDIGETPVELTREFIVRMPNVWPAINVPIPYGETPLTEQWYKQNRLLPNMPFNFFRNPYLTFIPENYDAVTYYKLWLTIRQSLMSRRLLVNRWLSKTSTRVKFMNTLRALSMKKGFVEVTKHLAAIESDEHLRKYHRGESTALPEYYHNLFEKQLGKYATLLPRKLRYPELGYDEGKSEYDIIDIVNIQ